jgi:UDP-sugar transporter A1/2/3
MPSVRQWPIIVASMAMMAVGPFFNKLSQNSEGKNEYSSASAVLMMELSKIVISLGFLKHSGDMGKDAILLEDLLKYSVPALLYFINNNLTFWVLARVDVTTYQLVAQLKILFTAMLFRFMLKKSIGYYQYLAIWQLACGVAVSQIPRADMSHAERASSLEGVAALVFFCFISGLAGVYNEKLLKDNPASIHFQNVLLYSWGIIMNLLGVLHDKKAISEEGFFHGWNFWTVVLVTNNALVGLAISAILKYADNIARVYAASGALLVTMACSVVFLHDTVSPQLLLGIAVVTSSAIQYNVKPEQVGFGEAAVVVSPKADGGRKAKVTFDDDDFDEEDGLCATPEVVGAEGDSKDSMARTREE